jgi:hypothetical protein
MLSAGGYTGRKEKRKKARRQKSTLKAGAMFAS